MVFQPEAAPDNHCDFLKWYLKVAEWGEGHAYDDPAVTTEQLRSWFLEIIEQFPPLNGPFSKEALPEDEATATEYSVGKNAIYACFAWSKVEPAYRVAFELAEKHKVGFFNASSNKSEVWLPGPKGLVLAHQAGLIEKLRDIFRKK